MKRGLWLWGLTALLLLSVGLNLGLLLGGRRAAPEASPVVDPPLVDLPERPVAGPPPGPSDRHLLAGAERIAERLGLAGAEREQFVAVQREFVEGMVDARWRQGRVRAALRRELIARRPDRERIENLVEESAGISAQIDRLLAEHVLRSREILDGEAEARYLRFLGHLGSRSPGPRPELRRRP